MMDSKYPGLAIQPDMGRRAGPMVRLLRPLLRAQFGQPSGVVGQIVGQIMAHAKSNTERTLWTLSLLDIRPGDRMLEIGCGPGVALEIASQMASTGIVVGVDHSEVMVRQAAKRNARAIRDGRIQVHLSSAEQLPSFDQPFDKIFSINSVHFWKDPVQSIRRLRGLLAPSGVLALTLQPRSRNATDETTRIIGQELMTKLQLAGFADCSLELRHMKPIVVACALGRS
jgi:cyclopropane fatty-acyl-phospholipid synthase-like methyltransferase